MGKSHAGGERKGFAILSKLSIPPPEAIPEIAPTERGIKRQVKSSFHFIFIISTPNAKAYAACRENMKSDALLSVAFLLLFSVDFVLGILYEVVK